MSFDDVLGQSMEGNQLPTIPPNASHQQTTAILNRIIDALNNNSQEVVLTGQTDFTYGSVDGSNVVTLAYTLQTIPHHLGYAPRASLYLNNLTTTFKPGDPAEQVLANLATSLPCPLNRPALIEAGGTDPLFYDWLSYFVDTENLYILYAPIQNWATFTLPTDPAHYTVSINYELHRQSTG